MSDPIVVTETLGGSLLSRSARAGELPEWYRPIPRTREAWRAHAAEVTASVATTWLEHLRPAIQPRGVAAERLERVANGRGVVVTTGQQPGLFGGPLMTLVKALSARAYADELEEQTGLPTATVFWAATDDADFDEAAVVWLAGKDGVEELRLAPTAPAGTPMSAVPIGDDVLQHAKRLVAACGSASNRAALDAAVAAYGPGKTVGGAYVELLRELLSPLGIGVVDASHDAVRAAAAPVYWRALENAARISAALRTRAAQIDARGFTPQVEDIPELSLVFATEGGIKRRLPLSDAQGLRRANGDHRLSSTVLLRPIVERAILPTIGYVAGPGEFAYFAQVSAVAEHVGVPAPLVLPRWSATIIEPRLQRTLDELGIAREDLRDPHKVESRLAELMMPPAVTAALATLRGDVAGDVSTLASAAAGLVPPKVFDRLQASLAHQVNRADRRLAAAVKRRELATMRRIAGLRACLYPLGVPQERKLSYIPLLARYGSWLVDRMLDEARRHAAVVTTFAPAATTGAAPVVPAQR